METEAEEEGAESLEPVLPGLPAIHAPAPYFKGVAVVHKSFKHISLDDYLGHYLLLVFYKRDFSFNCPGELIALSEAVKEFKKINTSIVACSTDSQYAHLAWMNFPIKDGGPGELKIPLLSDLSKKISRDYGVLDEKRGIASRISFIIDTKGLLRQITGNDTIVGRSVEEAIRLIQAFQFSDKHGELCPANWWPGDRTISTDHHKMLEYVFNENNNNNKK